jgi:soluble cytochrome b562
MPQSRLNASSIALRGAATLAAVALALLAAGCGGGGGSRLSKSQYETRIQKDGNDIRNVFTPLNSAPKSLKQLAAELKAGEDKLRQAADDLAKDTPPKDVEADNTALVRGLRKLADELETLRTAAAKGDPKLVQTALGQLKGSHALVDAQQATNDMKKKGYTLGTLGK